MANLGPEEFRKRLERALNVGGNAHSPDDIARAVDEGRMQAWTKNDSLIVTEIIQYPQFDALHVVLAVGALEDVVAMISDLEEFGREHGCKHIRIEGRKGWGRILPKYGAKKSDRVIYERVL